MACSMLLLLHVLQGLNKTKNNPPPCCCLVVWQIFELSFSWLQPWRVATKLNYSVV
jgi:hypothetical protein